MKNTSSQNKNTGSVLLVTLVVTGLLGFTLASYLTMIETQNRSVARSQNWNETIPIAESGVEEAMMHLNKNCLQSDITSQPVNWTADGWVAVTEGYRKTNALGESHYSVTIVTASPYSTMQPAIFSEGYVPARMSSLRPRAFFAQVGGTVNQTVQQPTFAARKVKVRTSRDGIFVGAMVAKNYIDFKGNGISTDSFDSEIPAYNTGGLYDPAKALDNGDVAVNLGLINSVNVGNANISGTVAVGPGGSIAIGPNGKVGSAEWMADPTKTGIEPGRSRDDMNVSFPDVQIPFTGGSSTPTGRTVTNEVVTAISVTNTSASYPSGPGYVVTNTVTVTTVSYPTSGSYVGSVITNTAYTTTAGAPSSGTYVGVVLTNTISATSSNAPTAGTYVGTPVTNSVVVSTTSYPSSPYGTVTTNTTWMANKKDYPEAGTYVGSVTTTYSPTRYSYYQLDGYTYRKITGYTYEQITSYSYWKISGYRVASIESYSLIDSAYTTNYVAKYYDYVLEDGVKYQIDSLDGDILVLGHAILYITDDAVIDTLQINPNSSLKLYMAGEKFAITGNTVLNMTGKADNFRYYGLPSNTEIKFAGNGDFTGVIYAPEANFHLGGGGSGTIDFIGACVTKTVQMNGHFNFHYDEALRRTGISRGYVIGSWDEIRMDETH